MKGKKNTFFDKFQNYSFGNEWLTDLGSFWGGVGTNEIVGQNGYCIRHMFFFSTSMLRLCVLGRIFFTNVIFQMFCLKVIKVPYVMLIVQQADSLLPYFIDFFNFSSSVECFLRIDFMT